MVHETTIETLHNEKLERLYKRGYVKDDPELLIKIIEMTVNY
jgi:transposase